MATTDKRPGSSIRTSADMRLMLSWSYSRKYRLATSIGLITDSLMERRSKVSRVMPLLITSLLSGLEEMLKLTRVRVWRLLVQVGWQ